MTSVGYALDQKSSARKTLKQVVATLRDIFVISVSRHYRWCKMICNYSFKKMQEVTTWETKTTHSLTLSIKNFDALLQIRRRSQTSFHFMQRQLTTLLNTK